MNDLQRRTAATCLAAADTGEMTFPQIVGALGDVGFESYTIDFRRGTATYFLGDGDHTELEIEVPESAVAADLDTVAIADAIRDAQQLVPGYTYPGFCNRIAAAGCAGYTVSIIGRRAIYVGRTAATHTERFPD